MAVVCKLKYRDKCCRRYYTIYPHWYFTFRSFKCLTGDLLNSAVKVSLLLMKCVT